MKSLLYSHGLMDCQQLSHAAANDFLLFIVQVVPPLQSFIFCKFNGR